MTKNRIWVVVLMVGLMALLSACQLDTFMGYNVSGKVTDANGTGVAGVKMTFSTLAATCVTGNDGSWTMTGLKGSVVVTPVKEGYTFTPATQTVTGADLGVDFVADLADETKLQNVIVQFCDYLKNGDASAVVSLYDDSYFGPDQEFTTREEMIAYLTQELSYYAYDPQNIIFNHVTCNGEVGQVGVRLELILTDLEYDESMPFVPYMLFDMVKRDTQWFITRDVPYSPEETILVGKFQAFLDALQNEDLEAIRPLFSDTTGKYDWFVAKWTDLLATMDIQAYIFKSVYISRVDNTNIVSMYGEVVVTVNGVEETRSISFWFSFEEFAGDWLITVVYLDGLDNY